MIAKYLSNGISSPGEAWQVATVNSILTNEKYKGDALYRSLYSRLLSKKKKDNEGEIPQYYVQNSHPAIIDL